VLGLLAAPLAAEAQPAGKVWRIGVLADDQPLPGAAPSLLEAFRQGLREFGWTEGQNFVLEYRSASGRLERIPGLATDLVSANVDIFLLGANVIHQARHALANVPAVFVIADDPVSAGYVASLARPGGRMTGLTSLNVGLDAKRLEILKVTIPGVRHIGVVSTPHDRARSQRVAAAETGARSLGVQLTMFEIQAAAQIPDAFDAAKRARVGALMLLGSPPLYALQGQTADLATKARLPVISAWRDFPEAGGLMSYGTNVPAMFRRAAFYVDRILKGATPAELPVEQATTFELVVNLKTAKALGLTIPPSLLQRADQIIE
jgi:putative ABC transport system substrate-binding protein